MGLLCNVVRLCSRVLRVLGEYVISSLLVASGLPDVGVADPHATAGLCVAGGCGAVGGAAAAISW